MPLQDHLRAARVAVQDPTLGLCAIWPGGTNIYLYDKEGKLLDQHSVGHLPWAGREAQVKQELERLISNALPF